MATVNDSIEVNVPVTTAYNQWTQFEEFPHFMEGVKGVRQTDDSHLHWHAEIGGKDLEWDAEIVEQVPDHRIAWRSISGRKNDGIVTFAPTPSGGTQIHLEVDYEPEGAMEKMGDTMGVVSRRLHSDLERFKDFIEKRGKETGGWRGEIH